MKRKSHGSLRLLLTLFLSGALLWHMNSRADSGEKEVREAPPPAAPSGSGMPKAVRVGVQFVGLDALDENAQTFDATVDVRLSWVARGAPEMELRGEGVEAALEALSAPQFEIANLVGEPAFRERGLFVDSSGRVELLERTQGTFAVSLDERDYPFDDQQLGVEVAVREASINDINLEFHGDDVAFSKVDGGVSLSGWELGIVDLEASPIAGWHDQVHARVIAKLNVRRDWLSTIPTVFVPLFSSLLIPLIALWLQKVSDDGEFEIDAFELANIVIGGLFAVIALNFTVNSEHSALATGDNTVSRLFALNYLVLASAMVVNITMFQYNFVAKWFGKYVQEELFWFLSWAIPVFSFGTAATFLLVSWA